MSIEAGIEIVPAATDNKPPHHHTICGICHPEEPPPMGTTALCGWKILGVKARPGSIPCPICTDSDVRYAHAFLHTIGGR